MGFVRRRGGLNLAPFRAQIEAGEVAELLERFRDFCGKLGGSVRKVGYRVGTTYYSCLLPRPVSLKLRVSQHPRVLAGGELKPGRIEFELSRPAARAWFHERLNAVEITYLDGELHVTHHITAASTHNTASGLLTRVKEIILGLHPAHPDRFEIRLKTEE